MSEESQDELKSRLYSDVYDGSVAWCARIVLWHDEGYSVVEIARMANSPKPTVYKWIDRYVKAASSDQADTTNETHTI